MPTDTATSNAPERMPTLYLGHGAPMLLDDRLWTSQLRAWSGELPRPKAILIVSAHWESAPLAVSAGAPGTPLVYDFSGFDPKYYRMTYQTPDAQDFALRIAAMMPGQFRLHQHTARGLDHGAWVPLKVMYPKADIPVLQMSLPTLEPGPLLELGALLRPLRDEGVLIIGSGFMTHGLPFLKEWRVDAPAPGWSKDFDLWAAEALSRGDVEELAAFRDRAPGMPYAHPSVEHFAPLFVTLGAADDPTAPVHTQIDGYFIGLAKRSFWM